MDRIQQLRREYLQARREGAAPAYEELEARRRGPEYDQHRVRHQTHTHEGSKINDCQALVQVKSDFKLNRQWLVIGLS